jgi:hypothetical protein
MSYRWGVNCATCGKFIDLGPQNRDEKVTTYFPEKAGPGPIPCECGSSHLYGTRDVVDEAGVFLNPWPEWE